MQNDQQKPDESGVVQPTTVKPGASGPLDDAAVKLARKLVEVGINGIGPIDSAADVAAKALRKASDNREEAIDDLVSAHTKLAAAGGFATGIGGFITLPVALPANVIEFYLLATRLVAAIAHLRGYDLNKSEVRTAVLLTLTGTDSRSVLNKVGFSAKGKIADVAMQQLPPAATMVLNKAIGVHLLTQFGSKTLSRLGRVVPVVGGAIGAGLDWWLLRKIGGFAREQFPLRAVQSKA